MEMNPIPHVEPFFQALTGTWTCVVHDGPAAVIIDPVLDYDSKSGAVETTSIDKVMDYIAGNGLTLERILETHAHADHLTGARFLPAADSVPVGIGAGIRKVQAHFAPVFGIPADAPELADAFAETHADGDRIQAGGMTFEVMATPGHTSDSLSYRIGDNVFVGDTIFAPDLGTARCDFPGGGVEDLYRSIERLHALPGHTRLWLCHDYPPAGREPRAWVSVEESRRDNRMLSAADNLETFAERRHARDAVLAAPKLLYPSLQVNIRGGALPPADAEGRRYLITPITLRT